ncbi:Tpo5 protein [Martiniozyma asiatica (nom. inval.)]|nr:Tpo5 protein [Martiniozyma asiatica]
MASQPSEPAVQQPNRLLLLGNQIVQDLYLDDDNAEEVLHTHYDHILDKKFTVGSLVGLGFSLMNVPFGVSTTLAIGLVCGSCLTILWGWLIFGFFTLFIALSLCEISSKYPTSGGVYHFACILAPGEYGLSTSWFDGWYLIIGNLLMFVSCAFGGAQFILSMLGLTMADYKHDDLIILVIFMIIVVLSALINLKFQKSLEKINYFCIYWTVGTILITDILILIFANDFHSIKYILTHFDTSNAGWPKAIAFIIGAFQFPSMTFNGYGAIVAMSEEVKNPEKNIPKGLVYSILTSILTGLVFIIPILAILPPEKVINDNPDIFPIDVILKVSTKSFLVSLSIALMIVGAVMFATVGSLTTVSRMIFSFGRDKGLPFPDLWEQVDTMDDEHVPKNALLLAAGISIVLGCFSLVSSAALNAFIGCSVIAMNLANGIPILCSIFNKRRKIRGSTFKLRKFGYIVNIISCIGIFLTIIILSLPPSLDIDIKSMNYAFVVFFIFTIFITTGWYGWGRHNFRGPSFEFEGIPLKVISERLNLEDLWITTDQAQGKPLEPLPTDNS